ncbi:sensor histidine kinase [Pseudoalteromonas sp. MM17-2]|uniref:sensor histidine kinase n=1 Tax=Pseudoalteromonas sp. MM17-2 TaxID=2917753 RepID=UPI001EF5B95E|nr:sensor histidine kinase [Pseudoalteromonas sp. MM17-2]MCG7543439.1 sensor histidine kinase [Pseudoalteromonas sp. MM17-2]
MKAWQSNHFIANWTGSVLVLFTCAIVAGFVFYSLHHQQDVLRFNLPYPDVFVAAVFTGFVMLHLLRTTGPQRTIRSQKILATAQFSLLLILLFWIKSGLILILSVVYVASLVYLAQLIVCLALALIMPLAYFATTPTSYDLVNSLLFIAYHLFALRLSYALLDERRANERNKALLQELSATQVLLQDTAKRDERLRIARDIHDSLGHGLTALNLQLELAQQLSHSAQPPLAQCKHIITDLLAHTRDTVSTLRAFDNIDLKQALTTLIADTVHPVTQLHYSERVKVRDARIAELLFRATQEALTNVRKHAYATRCDISLWRQQQWLLWRVEDDGMGINHHQWGNGLKGMQERVMQLDGELTVTSLATGTRLDIALPLGAEADSD